MVKICQAGLLKLNFQIRPKKCIFRFLPKISAGQRWSWNFFCYFPNPWTLRVSGMGGYTSKCEKSRNHCTLMNTVQYKAGSLKMNTALEYSTRVVQEGSRRCKKSTLNDLIHLTPLRIPLMNPPIVWIWTCCSTTQWIHVCFILFIF